VCSQHSLRFADCSGPIEQNCRSGGPGRGLETEVKLFSMNFAGLPVGADA
jgi:hypothetical protein